MIRRGIWQNKQGRLSSCLLCRSTSLWARPLSSSARSSLTRLGDAPTDSREPSTSRDSPATSLKATHACLTFTNVAPIRPGLQTIRPLSNPRVFQRFYSGPKIPGWATAPPPPISSPKPQAPSWATTPPPPIVSPKPPPPPPTPKPAPPEEAQLPDWTTAAPTPIASPPKPPRAPNSPLPAWATGAPPPLVSPSKPPPPRTSQLPSWATAAPPPIIGPKPTAPPATPEGAKLGHENNDVSREYHALQARRRRANDRSSTTSQASSLLGTPASNVLDSLTNPEAQQDAPEWKNLTRRDRKLQSQPDKAASADPWKVLRGNISGEGAGEDPWKVLEKTFEKAKGDKEEKKADDSATWDWADEATEQGRRDRTKRIARQLEEKATAASVAEGGASRRKDDRRSKDWELEEGRSKKPKKSAGRRRDFEEDEYDEWDEELYEERRRRKAEREAEKRRQAELAQAMPTPIFLPEYISVTNLAVALGQKVEPFVQQLEEFGFEDVSKDSILTGETAALVAQEYGFEPTVDTGESEDLKPRPPPEDPSSLPLRPPVVTIMGHVDHGKTTLLDYLRKSSIVSQEHGGITQHIGAFSVTLSSGQQITFLDTPGHAAFLTMRQRGAFVTDMVVLVVAADDSVMPQTLEAIKHARAANVPMIVAINKIDKPEANIDRVKADLANHGVEIEDFGGDVQVVCVSGKTGQGMDDLEENILLLAEMLNIRAERDGMVEGWVLESTIKPVGRVATVLVKRGTLRKGDYLVAGCVQAKVRALRNEAGVEVQEAPPGTAVEVLGWKEPPEAGDQVLQAPDEGRAKAAVRYRQEIKERGEAIAQMAEQEKRERERQKALEQAAAAEAGEADADAEDANNNSSNTKSMLTHVPFVIKCDVRGSVEAVSAAVQEQGNHEVQPKILVAAPGQITESDVEHAAVAGGTIINFNLPVPNHIRRMAADAKVAILEHNVIYHLIEAVRDKLSEGLAPTVTKKVVGEAEVLQIFPINVRGRKFKNIAGCRIGNGIIKRGALARVIRNGETLFEGSIETLKHVKKEVDEMRKGQECGISFDGWDDMQIGDIIQTVEEVKERRKL
ncbi:hypothetical protein VTJ04DRAFT_7198 [Mycothermus thermophilus]|uniref:uncharacterized protein n=1 Tax=Humicola insolens TaxID=85995 RepID=UPI0037431E1E